MTEPTIAKVLEQYPDVTEFVDATGTVWVRTCFTSGNYLTGGQIYQLAVPGLRPRPQKRKVTVEGFIHNPGIPYIAYSFTTHPYCNQDKPATLTYEIDEVCKMTDYVSTFSDELIEEELEFRYGATSADYLHELKRALSHIKFLEAHSKMDKADIKNLENDLEALETKNKVLERTEVKLRESCQRLGERNRHLESLKTKADEMAEFYYQGKHYIFEYLDGSSTEVCIEFGEKADGYLEASKELDE